jgi:phosphohistidine phosphatase
MTIYVLRHGDAVESTTLHDSERPLSELGRHQAATAGRFLRLIGDVIHLMLVSPLARAREMADGVKQILGEIPTTPTEHLTSSSDPRQVIDQIAHLGVQSVMIVGHEPHLSRTISFLISGSQAQCVELKKASLACLEIATPVEPGKAVLKWLLTSQQMERASESVSPR